MVAKVDIDLRQGDCLEVMKSMDEGCVDLTVTSPPYDNLRTYNDTLQWNQEIWQGIIKELYRVTATGGVVVWVVADATIKGSETGTSFKQALYFMACGFNLHDTMIWRKLNPLPLNANRYEPAFEYMFVMSKVKPKTWNPVKVPAKGAGGKSSGSQIDRNGVRRNKYGLSNPVNAEKVLGNVWGFVVGGGASVHPAVFPKSLAIDHIKSWSNKGDIIFDPFLGSGTTGVAAIELDRNFIGIEKDETYFKIAKKRIETELNKPRQLTLFEM